MSLKGKLALITGSSRGIGRGIALKLAQKGAQVAINCRQNLDAANETLARVRGLGSSGFVIQGDVSRSEDIQRIFEQVRTEFGRLDIFVSNALGDIFAYYRPPLEITPDQWSLGADSQAKAFLLGVQESARLLADGGRIVAISYQRGSLTGGWQSYIAQGSSKAAVESLVRYFAVALAKRRITINAISPGITEGSILNSLPQEAQDAIRDWHKAGWTPMGRLATTEDIGNAVAMLCSQEANWITGQTITVDGGASLMNSDFPLELQLG